MTNNSGWRGKSVQDLFQRHLSAYLLSAGIETAGELADFDIHGRLTDVSGIGKVRAETIRDQLAKHIVTFGWSSFQV